MKNKLNKIKLVAFDWNGTVIADVQISLNANNAVFKHFNLPTISLRKFQETFQVPFNKFWENLDLDLDLFAQKADEEEKVFSESYEAGALKVRTRTGIKKLLTFLKKNKIDSVIFSNHVEPYIHNQLNRLNISHNFSKVLARPLHGREQQFKRFKENLLVEYVSKHGLKPHEVMVVGDTDEEIEIGHKFGYTTIALTGGYQTASKLKKLKPHYLINSPDRIIDIIKSHV